MSASLRTRSHPALPSGSVYLPLCLTSRQYLTPTTNAATGRGHRFPIPDPHRPGRTLRRGYTDVAERAPRASSSTRALPRTFGVLCTPRCSFTPARHFPPWSPLTPYRRGPPKNPAKREKTPENAFYIGIAASYNLSTTKENRQGRREHRL